MVDRSQPEAVDNLSESFMYSGTGQHVLGPLSVSRSWGTLSSVELGCGTRSVDWLILHSEEYLRSQSKEREGSLDSMGILTIELRFHDVNCVCMPKVCTFFYNLLHLHSRNKDNGGSFLQFTPCLMNVCEHMKYFETSIYVPPSTISGHGPATSLHRRRISWLCLRQLFCLPQLVSCFLFTSCLDIFLSPSTFSMYSLSLCESLSICHSHVCLFMCLSLCLSLCLSACMCICLCLSNCTCMSI